MASASDHRAHAALQPADCLILLHQRLPATVETSIGPAHYPAECTQSDAFLQPSLRARNGRANSNSFAATAESLIRSRSSLRALPKGRMRWSVISIDRGTPNLPSKRSSPLSRNRYNPEVFRHSLSVP